MRRRWGKGIDFSFLRNITLSKQAPRKWGRRTLNIRGGALPKPIPKKWGSRSGLSGIPYSSGGSSSRSTPRKWGTRKWFSSSGSSSSGYSPSAKWASKRPRRKMKRSHFWLITILVMLFLIIQGTIFLDRELRHPLMFLAKIKVNQLATEAINTAITDEIAQTADSNKMIKWRTTADGKITGFEMDYKEQMALTAKTIDVVNRVLKEHEGVPEKIPIGHALNSPFISSIGPHVSVEFHPLNAVKVDVETKQSEAGINMLLVEVYVRIRTEIAVVIPFDKEPEVVETKIPLSYALVVGDVPTYYYDNKGNPVGNGAAQAPAITLPNTTTNAAQSQPQPGAQPDIHP